MELISRYKYIVIGIFSLIFVFFVYLIKNDGNSSDKNNYEDDDEIIPIKKNKLKEIARKNKELKDKLNGKSIAARNSKPDKSTIASGDIKEGKGETEEGNEPKPDEPANEPDEPTNE